MGGGLLLLLSRGLLGRSRRGRRAGTAELEQIEQIGSSVGSHIVVVGGSVVVARRR